MADGIAWIIGGGSGIGAAMAHMLADQGWTVAISGRRESNLRDVAGSDPKLRPYPLDVTDAAAAAQVTQRITSDLGRIDLVIFGAAAYQRMNVGDYDPSKFETVVRTNFLGVVNVVDPVVRQMRAQGGGQLAIIASLAGYFGLPRATAYNSTKAALISLGESLHTELKPDNIDVRIVSPGFFKSELTAKNDFPMPFLMEVDEAARRTLDGLLRSNRFEVAYPRRLAWIMKLLRLLPYPALFAIADRMMPKRS